MKITVLHEAHKQTSDQNFTEWIFVFKEERIILDQLLGWMNKYTKYHRKIGIYRYEQIYERKGL